MVSLPQLCPRCETQIYNYSGACHNPECNTTLPSKVKWPMADSIATDDGPDPRPCDAPHCRQSEERAAWEANRTTTDAYQASLREEAEKARAEADLLTETEAIVDKLSDEVLDLCEFIRDTVTGPIPDRVREIMFERLA